MGRSSYCGLSWPVGPCTGARIYRLSCMAAGLVGGWRRRVRHARSNQLPPGSAVDGHMWAVRRANMLVSALWVV
jgi:hypothetical protein